MPPEQIKIANAFKRLGFVTQLIKSAFPSAKVKAFHDSYVPQDEKRATKLESMRSAILGTA